MSETLAELLPRNLLLVATKSQEIDLSNSQSGTTANLDRIENVSELGR